MDIFNRHVPYAYKIAGSYLKKIRKLKKDPEDLYQISLMALWESCNTFKKDKGAGFKSHSFTTIKHRILNFCYVTEESTIFSSEWYDDLDKIESNYSANDYLDAYSLVIRSKTLNPVEREILLYHLQDLDMVDIAKKLKCTRQNVDFKYRSAVKKMRKELCILQ